MPQTADTRPVGQDQPAAEPATAAGVLAVLVAHDGAAWLPACLAALRAQTRAPERILAVDTGSTDTTGQLLRAALGGECVLSAAPGSGFGAAVAAAVAHAGEPHQRWIWLLHDDCAPDPRALEQLLAAAAAAPSAAVLGPKLVGWARPRRLLEVGVSVDRAGRRSTGLEPGELDQGQQDRQRDVLAVSTAAALVRRDVWDALGGLDPALALLRDELDFGIRVTRAGHRVVCEPSAQVRHARALLAGRRSTGAVPAATRALDRSHGHYALLVNQPLARLVAGLPLVVLGALLRAVGDLLTRRPGAARDELIALAAVLARPGRLLAGRRWRRRHGEAGSWRRVSPLLVRRGARLRAATGALGDWITGGAAPPPPPGHGALETGPSDNDDLDLPEQASVARRIVGAPGVALFVTLGLVSLIGLRHLLGAGTLSGGRLLAVPNASTLWAQWLDGWHPVGVGSSATAAPWVVVLAALGSAVGGSAAGVLTVLLILALPLAGLAAYRAARVLQVGERPRLWAGLSYPLLSGLLADIAAGRFDVAVAVVAIPGLLAAGSRLLREDPAEAGWRRGWALGLGLALTVAFAPALVPAVGVLAVVAWGWLLRTGRGAARPAALRRCAAVLIALLVPVVLLGPFTLRALAHPSVLLVGLGAAGGLAGATGTPVGAARLLLLHPSTGFGAGGPGWLAGPLLVAALLGLLRTRRRVAEVGFALAGLGYALALLDARTRVNTGYGWPGVGLALAAAGLTVAALIAAERARSALARHAFGLRQPLVGLVALAALAAPLVVAGGLVVLGGAGPVGRAGPGPVPPFVTEYAALAHGERILVLSGRAGAGELRYSLTSAVGAQAGQEDLAQPGAARSRLAEAVAQLAAPIGSDAANVLATYQVGYVVAAAPVSASLAAALDAQPQLSRQSSPNASQLWKVVLPTARVQLLAPPLAAAARSPAAGSAATGRGPSTAALTATPPTALPTGVVGAQAQIPAGPAGRLVVLADAASSGWRARLGGQPLHRVLAWGWAQAFALPATIGPQRLVISYPASRLRLERVGEAAVLLIVVVLAAPALRRARPDPDDELTTPPPTEAASQPELLV